MACQAETVSTIWGLVRTLVFMRGLMLLQLTYGLIFVEPVFTMK